MAGIERVLRARRVVLPDGTRPASIHISGGRVVRIGAYDAAEGEDLGDLAVLPGLVDTHVHINEPGRTEWEGFATATRAAAAGGITTLIEMPLNAVPATTTVAAYREKIAAATGQCWVDIGFWGGVVPGNTDELAGLLEAGCFGFKCFLTPSGVDEFENVTESDLREAMPELARLGAVLLVHAESPDVLREAQGDPRDYRNYLASRPPAAEHAAIDLMTRLSRETGCRVHIVHLSAADAPNLPFSVETCPHYLCLSAEEIPTGATEFKCAPPIRDSTNRERLWDLLRTGGIQMIVTDHSPSPPAMKCCDSGDFFRAWGGIASLQLSLPAVWTEAQRRGFTLDDIARWMSSAPSQLAGLSHCKGSIAPGMDADLVVFDPEASITVDASALHHRHKLTPYAGRKLNGIVRSTWLRGEPVDLHGDPRGQFLRRPAGLSRLNEAPFEAFLRCCGSRRWAHAMAAARPFSSQSELEEIADRIWSQCTPDDFLEAFAAHPRIGQRSSSRWSTQEQAGAATAAAGILDALAEKNRLYEQKFGYIYIVCATGRSADELLAMLERRLSNDPDVEISEAAEQQRQITKLRLRKLLHE